MRKQNSPRKSSRELIALIIARGRNDVASLGTAFIARYLGVLLWRLSGKPVPPPPRLKQKILRSYVRKFGLKTVIETGTYLGDMIAALEGHVPRIYSVELDRKLYEEATQRFSRNPGVRIMHGDSSQVLPKLLGEVSGPALFWLDAHYSGGVTARANVDTPILDELSMIFARRNSGDVILIDDARLFVGTNDYPTMNELRELVSRAGPGRVLTVEADIIRIVGGEPAL